MANPYLDLAQQDISGRLVPDPARDNPYMAIAQEDVERENQRLIQSLGQASQQNPVKAGESQRISQQTGVPAGLVQTDLDNYKRQAYLQDLEMRRLATSDPILAKQLQDPEFAAISHDQLDMLTWTGRLFRDVYQGHGLIGDVVRQFEAGRLGVEESRGVGHEMLRSGYGLADMPDWMRQKYDAIEQRKGDLREGEGTFAGDIAEFAGQMSMTLPEVLSYAGATGLTFGAGAMAAGSAGPQALIPEEAVTVPAAGLLGLHLGGRYKAGQVAFEQEAGAAYIDMLKQGASPKIAQWVALGYGAVATALEEVSLGVISKPFMSYAARKIGTERIAALIKPTVGAALKRFGIAYGEAVGSEVGTEELQEVSNIIAEEIALKLEGKPSRLATREGQSEAVERLKSVGSKTFNAMLVFGAVGPSFNLEHDFKKVRAAEKQAEFFGGLNRAATENEVIKRNPAAYQRFLQAQADGAKVENVYIDANQFVNVLGQAGVTRDQVDQVLPGIATKIDEALQTGSDVVIPTGEYGTTVAGTDLGNALLPHVRLTPDAFSIAEAQQFQKEKEQLIKAASDLLEKKDEQESEFVKSAADVKRAIEDQINATGIYRPEEARTMATMHQAMYVVHAAEMGITPMELYERIKNPVTLAGEANPAMLSQDNVSGDVIYRGRQKGAEEAPATWWSNSRDMAQIFADSIRGKKTKSSNGEVIEKAIPQGAVVKDLGMSVTDYPTVKKVSEALGVSLDDLHAAMDNSGDSVAQIMSEESKKHGGEYEIRLHSLLELPSVQNLLEQAGVHYVKAKEQIRKGEYVDTYLKLPGSDNVDDAARHQLSGDVMAQSASRMFSGMPERAREIADRLNADGVVKVDAENGTMAPTGIFYSTRTWTQQEKDQIKELAAEMGIDEGKVGKWMYDIDNAMARVLADPSLDFIAEAADLYSALKPNSDPHYTVSLDFSTLCRKRYQLIATIEAIQNIMGRAITKDTWVDVREMLDKMHYDVSCGACYVDSKRLEAGEFINKFIDEHPDEDPKQFLSQRGIDRMKRENPALYKKFKKAIGANNAKTPESRTDYHGEIRWYFMEGRDYDSKATQETGKAVWTTEKNEVRGKKRVEQMNRKSGLRWQSWSDFEVPHLLDAMQAILDMHMAGLMGHAYTKVPEFVLSLGRTGLMVNMSLIPKGSGLADDGTLVFDSKEGMDFDVALQLRDQHEMTAGTIAIGVNDAQIKAMLADPRIDYVIPYHASGLARDIARRFNMDGWDDYTDVQSEDIADMETFHAVVGKRNAKVARAMIKIKDPAAWAAKEIADAEKEITKAVDEIAEIKGKSAGKALNKTQLGKISSLEKKQQMAQRLSDVRQKDAAMIAGLDAKGLRAFKEKATKEYRKLAKNQGLVSIDTTEYWDDTKTGRENADAYLRMAADRGLAPKFRGKKYSNGKVLEDMTREDGYWKLLIDRKMYDHSGTNIVQRPVSPEYDNDAIQEIYNLASGNPTPSTAVPEVVNTVVQAHGYTVPAFFQTATPQPTFFSALQRVFDGVKQESMPGSQWASWLKGNAGKLGIKKDEMEWTGIGEFLELKGKEKVSKQEIVEYLQQNGVHVTEVFHGSPEGHRDILDYRQGEGGKWEVYTLDGRVIRTFDNDVDARHFTEDRGEFDNTKYSQYTLPGGENYRELLLTLPSAAREMTFEEWWSKTHTGDIPESGRLLDIARDQYEREKSNMPRVGDFRSAHWDEPNILAHIRFNTRTDAAGNKVLFIEEIQSDWGQEGKKEGFDQPAKWIPHGSGARVDIDSENFWYVRKDGDEWLLTQSGTGYQEWFQTEQEAKRAAEQGLPGRKGSSVPSAPFVTDTKAWTALAIKRMIRYAAENGFDKVAFVNGEQSADRYDLSQQVDSILVVRVDEDSFNITADKNGNTVFKEGSIPAKRLSDVIGKELSEKAIKDTSTGRAAEYSGIDLKVGGEGMKAFYDQIVPSVAKDIIKKWGGKLGDIGFEKFNPTPGFFDSENQAMEWIDKHGLSDNAYPHYEQRYGRWSIRDREHNGDVLKLPEKYKHVQLGFTVTPEMRESVMQGQALFQSQLGQNRRGGFDPATMTTILSQQSDLTTFLHESGHFYLEFMSRLAAMPEATERNRADMQAILEWFGIPDLATWNAMSLEQQRPYHEQWAYNYEIYLSEGKAPSVKLQGIFDRFSQWMRRVYKSIRDDLNAIYRSEHGKDLPVLTGEVRQVMDRMLASEEEIRQAESIRNMAPLFQDQAQSGMDDVAWAAYQEMLKEAHDAAVTDLTTASIRQLKWLGNARSRVLKQLQREAEALRKEVRDQVAEDVRQEPVYRAERFIRKGELTLAPGANQEARRLSIEVGMEGSRKLDTDAVKEMFGEEDEIWRVFREKGKVGLTGPNGLHPDIVAEMVGFDSGHALVIALANARPIDEVIDERTDDRMMAEHGELLDPVARDLAVEKALHSEARARFVAVELRFLSKATAPVKVLTAAAKQVAKQIIAGKRITDIRPRDYSMAEARAAREAEKAMKSGESALAIKKKQDQLLQNHLASQAVAARQYVEKSLRYFERVLGDATRRRIGADYADQIQALLYRFGLAADLPIGDRPTLGEWLETQEESGFAPDIADYLVDERYTKAVKEMKLDEFEDLVDAIKQIEHIGKNRQKLLTAAKQADYQAARDEIVGSIIDNAGNREADPRTATTNLGRMQKSLKRFFAQHIKAAMAARILDGGKDAGAVWEYLIRPANERGDMETRMRADATLELTKILQPVFNQGKMGGKGRYFESVGRSFNKESVLTIALNCGNASNLQRLLDGEGWTMSQVESILGSLTAEELQTVQKIWDYFESFRPMIAAKERRVYGKEPKWIDPQPLTIKAAGGQDVTLSGGYYPVVYDAAASQQAEAYADAEGAKREMRGAFTSATTRRSFTKGRVEKVVDRPLVYTLSGLFGGVNDVIHDLCWHEWLIDANRLLRSKSIDHAIRTHYGEEWKAIFKAWAKDIAAGDKKADNEGALSWIRQGVSAAGLGFNVMSAILQVTGFTGSVVRIGAKWVGRGVYRAVSDIKSASIEVNEKSTFMADRARTQMRELNELRNQVQGETDIQRRLNIGKYVMMMGMQRVVDVPTWIGAYEKAVAEGHDEPTAVALADQAVIDSQGSGMVKDLAQIERGGPAMKLFTTYYGYMNTVFNMGAAVAMTEKSKGKLAAKMLMLYVVPVILNKAIKDALTPDDDDDDWDMEQIAQELVAEELSYLMGQMVIVREFSDIPGVVMRTNKGRSYGGPAGLRSIAESYSFAQQASQGEFDRAFFRTLINLVGNGTGLPAAQINRTLTGTKALMEGDTSNPAALVFGVQ